MRAYGKGNSLPRNEIPHILRQETLVEKGNACTYCGGEATCLDHVIPYAANPVHLKTNLVPSCTLCNAIAHDKVFPTFAAKRKYILQRRIERADTQLERRNFRLMANETKEVPRRFIGGTAKASPRAIRQSGRVLKDGAVGRPDEALILKARNRLVGLNSSGLSWNVIARSLGLSFSTVYHFAKRGYVPKRLDLLAKLIATARMSIIVQEVHRDDYGRFARRNLRALYKTEGCETPTIESGEVEAKVTEGAWPGHRKHRRRSP